METTDHFVIAHSVSEAVFRVYTPRTIAISWMTNELFWIDGVPWLPISVA